MNINPSTLIDGYKVGHIHQYPENTEVILSNLTARSTRRKNTDKVVFAGLQYFLKEYLIKQWNENFFAKPIEEVVHKFNRRINNYIVPNDVGDQHIRDLHKLGYLPIVILALPEGTEYPIKVPSLLIWDTDGRFGWFTNYLETILSTSIWGPCTSATTAHQYKKLLVKYAMETVGNTDFVQWQGHDFSFRGMFGLEAACMSGAAHLFSFTGTDTVPAIDFLEQYYNADCEKELIGGSVAATEHSVMAAGGAGNVIIPYEVVEEWNGQEWVEVAA
jgi:nicotinamide phosphoribosyltransferase